MSTFSERAMLASVKIHAWSAARKDEKVTQDTNAAHGASRDAGRYTKQLVPKEALEPIQKATSAIRGFHYTHTLPWADSGERILPITMHEDYTAGIRSLGDVFDREADRFAREYPTHVAEARSRLNGMYNAKDYPEPDEVRGLYAVDVQMWPFPDARDFRVALGEDQIKVLQSSLNERTAAAQAQAMRDCWVRLHTAVSHMAERLAVPIGGDGATFRDSLVENVRELCGLLPKLNIAGDPELDRMTAECRKRLLVPPGILRDRNDTRRGTAEAARQLADRMAKYAL